MSKPRKVIQYTMDGEEIRSYDSIREAQENTGVTHISSVCRRKRVSDGGSRWGYEGGGAPPAQRDDGEAERELFEGKKAGDPGGAAGEKVNFPARERSYPAEDMV